MPETFRITLAQLNPTVGDLPGNAAKARTAWQQARDAGSACQFGLRIPALATDPGDQGCC